MKKNDRLKMLPRVKFICSGKDCPKAGKCMAHDNYNKATDKEREENPKPISEALRITPERCFRPNYAVPRLKKSSVEQMFNRRRLEAKRAASGAPGEEPGAKDDAPG